MLFMGTAFAALGDNDKAMDWFEKAYAASEPLLIWIKSDPIVFDRMHSDHRYIQLLNKMNLD